MNHFKEAAKNWDTNEKVLRNKSFFEAITKHLDGGISNKAFIDFGCGTGLLASFFAEESSYLLGIDTTDEMLEEFNKKFERFSHVKTLNINLDEESFADDSQMVDAIFTAMAFHHSNTPIVALSKLQKLVKPGGKIFIIDLDEEDGSFHSNNQMMGVKHYGFSKDELSTWSSSLEFRKFSHEIIYEMNKNERVYSVFMAIFEN